MKQSKKKEELEAAVVEARAALETRRAILWAANVAAAQTGGDESWAGKRSAREAQEGVEAARNEMEVEAGRLAEAEKAFEDFMAAQERVEKSDFEAWSARAIEDAARRTARIRKLQADLLEEGKGLTALLVVARRKAPRRIVSRRSSVFVRVLPTDPKLLTLYPTADPPGSFRVELFRAYRGEREGKWKILPGQSLDPGPVEILWGDSGVPEELQAITDLDMGYLFKPNGTAGKMKGEKVTAPNIEHFLLDEQDLQAAANVAERA